MKRTLSLVLALVMVLGTFTTVFAATEAEKTAAEFLADEGILLGDDGDLMLNKNLERRDAVVLLSRLLGVEKEAAKFPTAKESPSWEDARTDAYYVPFFAWAESNGYFEGDDEGNFNPRNAITAQEYALVLLRALNYDVKGNEAWKAALETAEKAGLLKDVEVESKDKVVRGQMATMTFNALGAKMNGSDETLAEKLGIKMPEDPKAKELTAKVNDTENLMEVVVELSNAELADELRLENASNYKLNDGRTVKSAEVVEDNVVLLLDKVLVRNREYTLTIKGIDKAINGNYKFTARDNTVPTVESVKVLGEYGIKITASEPIKDVKDRNILIDGKRASVTVEGTYGRDIIVTPYSGSFDKNASELEIIELEDYAGYKSTSLREKIEIIEDKEAPEIVSSKMSGKKVTVEFDKDIRKASIGAYENSRDLGNASYSERRSTIYATKATKVDTNKVVYEFKNELPRNVELTIEGVENYSKVAMGRTKISPVLVSDDTDTVITNNDKRIKIEVSSDVYGTAKDKVNGVAYNAPLELTIKFDEKLDKETAENPANYTLYEKDLNSRGRRAAGEVRIDSAVLQENGKDVVVTFTGLRVNDEDKSYDYILEVNGLKTEGGVKIFRDYIDFEVVAEAESFKITEVKPYKNSDSIEYVITFNKQVDRNAALDEANYFFGKKDLGQLDGEVVVDNGGKKVTLVLPIEEDDQAEFFADYEVLEVLRRVTRSNGDRLSNDNRFFDTKTGASK